MSSDSALRASVPELRVSHLNHRYKSRSPLDRQTRPLALADISFEIARGQTLSIIGHTGSGKSTILRCVIGLEQPESAVLIASEPRRKNVERFTERYRLCFKIP
jgi:ABC-type glutathione transport system ATPase component